MKRLDQILFAIGIALVISFIEGTPNLSIHRISITLSVVNIVLSIVILFQSVQIYVKTEIREKKFHLSCKMKYTGLFTTIVYCLSYSINEIRWLFENLQAVIGEIENLIWLMTETTSFLSIWAFLLCFKIQIEHKSDS